MEANQHQIMKANLHSKNKWNVVSALDEHKEHIDEKEHPLY